MASKIKVYELSEIPARRARTSDEGIRPYLDAIRAGKAAGDGVAYESQAEAARAALRAVLKARRVTDPRDAYPGQRVWQDRAGKWYWALVPSQRRKA